jgi:hypothetical protein
MYSSEAKSFAKFLALVERFQAANRDNYVTIKKHKETGNFQAAFFALASLRVAYISIRSFIRINGTHTGSRFWIMLLITSSIDANSETLPLA